MAVTAPSTHASLPPARALMRRPNVRRAVMLMVGLVVAGVSSVIVAVAWSAHQTTLRERAWGELNLCLLGSEPLRADEAPSERVTMVKLEVVGVDPAVRTPPGMVPWPAVCAAPAVALAEHASDTPVGAAAELLSRALHVDVDAMGDNGAEVDRLWAMAKQAGLKRGNVTVPVEAPRAAKPSFTMSEFRALPPFLSGDYEADNLHVEPRSGAAVRFLLDQKVGARGPVSCEVDAVDPAPRCTALPADAAGLSPGIRLVGTTDDGARPLLFAGDRGQLGIFWPDGRRAVLPGRVFGAHAHVDGSATLLYQRLDDQTMHAALASDGAVELDTVAFDGRVAASESTLVEDWLLWRVAAPTDQPRAAAHLYARRVGSKGLGPVIDVGSMQDPSPHVHSPPAADQVEGCRSHDVLAVRARGLRADHVSFYTGAGWSVPVEMTTHGGAFTCHGLEAISTLVEHGSDRGKDSVIITQTKCETSGCRTARVDMRRLLSGLDISPIDAENAVAADVGGSLLVVWNAGPVGGLRMRSGVSVAQLKDAHDVVIAGTREERGGYAISSVQRMRLAVAESFALLFLTTTTGLKVLRIEPSTGKVTCVTGGLE